MSNLFQPGNPGGPGRPKKGFTFKELYEREMERIVRRVNSPEGPQETIDAKVMIARKRVLLALGGNQQAMDSIENRVDGHPAETLNVGGGGEFRVRIVTMTAQELKDMEGIEVQGEEGGSAPSPTFDKLDGPGAGSTGT